MRPRMASKDAGARFFKSDAVGRWVSKFLTVAEEMIMNAADFNELSETEKNYFYERKQCGGMVDMRELDGALFHEDHVQWKRIKLPVAVIAARCVSAPRPRSVFGRIVIVETAGEPLELRQ